ncbi:MAG: AAA family ATPase [Desulfobacterales bacterium]|nr:AAA family ATPase [Desulfobacterales bacterium]
MELSTKVSYEYFHIDIQWLYKAIVEHFTNPKFKEIPTENVIKEYLDNNYSDTKFVAKGINLFKEIKALSVIEEEFTWHLDKLKKRYNDQVQRVCAQNMVELLKKAPDGDDRIEKINQIMKESITTIDSIHRKEAYSEGALSESARERAKEYKEIEANPDLARGVLTGFSELDRITNGMHPGELMIIGGSTGTGKSIMMHNMAVNSYLCGLDPLEELPSIEEMQDGKNILYFSLEMPKKSQERRISACMANIVANAVRDGRLDKDDKMKYFKVLKFQAQYQKQLHIVDMARGVSPREIELKYVEMCDKYGMTFDQVYVDYLGLMKPGFEMKSASDWLELGYVAEGLHEFARAYGIPVVTASQLNRPKDPNKPQNSTDRIARSAMIPDNANIILQIACRGDDEHTRLDMPIYITKMRDGEKGSFTLVKDFARMKVTDIVDETFGDDDEF